jgi:hypothetical protein
MVVWEDRGTLDLPPQSPPFSPTNPSLLSSSGGIDTHIHFICPQQCDDALASGLTTFIGGGAGPTTGTKATTCTPSPEAMRLMLQVSRGEGGCRGEGRWRCLWGCLGLTYLSLVSPSSLVCAQSSRRTGCA